jgi:hypothetical protein
MAQPMKISNSMMVSADKCEKRFEFEHVYQIRPKEFPEPMTRGLAGHDLMEAFFKAMMDGKDYDECVEATNVVLAEKMKETMTVSEIYRHVLAFGAYVFQQGWKPVLVEENKLYPLGISVYRGDELEELEFAFTPDVIFEFTNGPRKGRRFIVDFKFTGQYWSDRELGVYQQLPKYVMYTNRMSDDRPIKHAAIVMLNTRAAKGATGGNLYLLKWIDLKQAKLDNIEHENIEKAMRVAQMRVEGEAGTREFLRTSDTYACKMCFFADDICPAQLSGRDITKMIERNYIHNTYFDDNYGEKPDAV